MQWSTSEASPRGLAIVGDTLFLAALRGERIWTVAPATAGGELTATEWFPREFGRIRDVVAGPDGTLWFIANNTDGRGSPRDGDDRLFEVRLDASRRSTAESRAGPRSGDGIRLPRVGARVYSHPMADLERVRRWAEALIALHLDPAVWTFGFDNAKKRAGLCNYTAKRITVSRYLAARYDDDEIHQILLHEVAHALAGPARGARPDNGRRSPRELGYVGRRTHDGEVAHDLAPWVGPARRARALPLP